MTNITISDRDGKPVKLATDTAPDPSGGKPIHTLKVSGASGGGGGTDVSALATEATLLALKNLVATQVEITATLWTDDSGAFYVRRDTFNETAGTVVVSWYTPTGAVATPGAGLRPTAEGKDYEITATTYAATASGTGYSNGDTIIHALMMATGPTAPTTATSVWLNVTTNAVLSVAPSLANLASTTTLPAGASTDALQTAGNTALGQIKTSIDAQSGTAGSPASQVGTVQGIAGGKTVKAAPEIDMQVTSGALEEHVYAAGELWTAGNIYMAGSQPKQAILDGLLIIVGGNHTCDLDVLFVRYDNYGGANAPVVGTTMASIADTLVNSVWATATLEPSMTIGGYTVYEAHGLGIVLKDWFLNSYMPVLAAPRNGSMTIGAATNKSPRLVTHLTFPANA